MAQVNVKASQSLADPAQYDNLFPGLSEALKTEQFLQKRQTRLPASACNSVPNNWDRRPIEEMQEAEQSNQFGYVHPVGSQDEEEVAETQNPSLDVEKPIAETVVADTLTVAASQDSQADNIQDLDGIVTSKNAPNPQLEQDLELDLDNLDLDDNVDTSDVNLDDDLLGE